MNTLNPTLPEAVFLLSLFMAYLIVVALQIYGIYLSFRKKWYIGVAALAVPGFGLVVGTLKFFFKKDILA